MKVKADYRVQRTDYGADAEKGPETGAVNRGRGEATPLPHCIG